MEGISSLTSTCLAAPKFWATPTEGGQKYQPCNSCQPNVVQDSSGQKPFNRWKSCHKLVGGWTNPLWTIWSSNLDHFPNVGVENKEIFVLPPPSKVWTGWNPSSKCNLTCFYEAWKANVDERPTKQYISCYLAIQPAWLRTFNVENKANKQFTNIDMISVWGRGFFASDKASIFAATNSGLMIDVRMIKCLNLTRSLICHSNSRSSKQKLRKHQHPLRP